MMVGYNYMTLIVFFGHRSKVNVTMKFAFKMVSDQLGVFHPFRSKFVGVYMIYKHL